MGCARAHRALALGRGREIGSIGGGSGAGAPVGAPALRLLPPPELRDKTEVRLRRGPVHADLLERLEESEALGAHQVGAHERRRAALALEAVDEHARRARSRRRRCRARAR